MHRILALSSLFLVASTAGSVAAAADKPAAGPTLDWSKGACAPHARAWFEALAAGETAMRAFYPAHQSAQSLVEKPAEQRIVRWLALREDMGTLTPARVMDAADDSITVLARSANHDDVRFEFRCEPSTPHRLVALAIEVGGPADSGPPGKPAERAESGPPLDDPAAVAALTAALDDAGKDGRFSGVALLARGGQPLLTRAVGLAERRFQVANREHTRFNVGSIGKIFTLIALAQLAEGGKISLDEPLAKYLPDFPQASRITLDMLARHRSGVGDFFGDRYDAADRSKLRHNRDYLPLFQDLPLLFPPGTSERYSNGGYVLLGEVIARASGEDYYDYLSRHIFSPAGMTATGAEQADAPTADVAMGYTRGDDGSGELSENVFTRPARGSAAGGSYSTVTDLLKLDQALAAGRLCGRGWSNWVMGGPRPSSAAAAAAAATAGEKNPGFGFAGGAPGIAAEWMHEGDLTLILLANLDPPVLRPVTAEACGILRRMRP